MSELMQVNAQWSTRPDEERYVSLLDMQATMDTQRRLSATRIVASRNIQALPADDNKGLMICGPSGAAYTPTFQAFGQLATLSGAPAGYLRSLPSPIAADCVNYGLKFNRDVEDVGLLLQRTPDNEPSARSSGLLRAATGPRYGRIWNSEIVNALVNQFGDGVHGRFKVPGEFGKHVEVTKANTTLYAGDRDMFVFLCDEENRIEVPGRRDGKSGTMARGFFCWNSEVGAATFGVMSFLFDYVCANRIVWGAQQVEEIKIRHTASAPVRFLEEIQPALLSFANSSQASVKDAIQGAKEHRLDNVSEFLAKRFGARVAPRIIAAHDADEGRPIETMWDAVTGITAYARGIQFQADRVDIETKAGELLQAF